MFALFKFVVRAGIFICVTVYIFPDIPSVVGKALGAGAAEMSLAFVNYIKEGMKPQWLNDLQTWWAGK